MKEKLVSEVAKELGRTPGRIRQLCGEYRLGQLLNNRLRVLTPGEIDRLREIVATAKPGPRQKNPKNLK